MIIVDKDIKRLLDSNKVIVKSTDPKLPFIEEQQVGAGSIDLRLSNKFRKYKSNLKEIDLTSKGDTSIFEVEQNEAIIIRPGEIVLTTTLELVILPPDIGGIITGRSSIARLGLMVQCCQDFIQPGHQQLIPLQLINITKKNIKINASLRVCQLVLLKGSSNSDNPYAQNEKSKYRNEIDVPSPSKIGVELGKETELELKDTKENNELVGELKKLKKLVNKNKSFSLLDAYSSKVAVPVYIVLGAAISVAMAELGGESFPNNIFLTSLSFIVFCIIMLIIINRRNVR